MADSSFSLDIAKFLAKLPGREDLVVRKIALDLTTRIVKRTPVDTGRARGNWSASLGAPDIVATEQTDKSGQATIAAASATVGALAAGTDFYLANSLPYIRRLEYGHSKQAPSGMLRTSVAEYPGVVDRAAAAVRQEIP